MKFTSFVYLYRSCPGRSCGHPLQVPEEYPKPSNSVRKKERNNIANLITARKKKEIYLRFVCIYILFFAFAPCQVPLKLTHYAYVLDANRNGQRTFTLGWPKGQKSNFAIAISWGLRLLSLLATQGSVFIAHQIVSLQKGLSSFSSSWLSILIAGIDSMCTLRL